MRHGPLVTRSADARRLARRINPPLNQRNAQQITVSTYYSTAPLKNRVASIVGPHRIVRMVINGNQPGPQPGIWDILISDHPTIDAAARLNDQRISGANTGRPGYFAGSTPDAYALNIVSHRPITYYKLIDQSILGVSTMATATLTAIRL